MFKIFLLIIILINAVGCNPNLVPIPSRAQDAAPRAYIHATPSGSTGRLDVDGMELNSFNCTLGKCIVYATIGTDIIITVDAVHEGGVQSLTVEMKNLNRPFETLAKVTRTANSVQGHGPKTLSIIGHNGAGSIGSQPLMIHVTEQTRVSVTVIARNFNGMSCVAEGLYLPLQKLDASIGVSEDNINKGQSTWLSLETKSASSWKVQPLSITGSGINEWQKGMTISPQETTTYTLTATNFIYDECVKPNKNDCEGAETKTVKVKVTVNQPPQPPITESEASVKLSFRMGPWNINSTSGKCTGSIRWVFTPVNLTGPSGINTTFEIYNTNYSADETGVAGEWYCFVENFKGGLRTGLWKVKIDTPGGTECNVQLSGGSNSIHFSQNVSGCKLNNIGYPGD